MSLSYLSEGTLMNNILSIHFVNDIFVPYYNLINKTVVKNDVLD